MIFSELAIDQKFYCHPPRSAGEEDGRILCRRVQPKHLSTQMGWFIYDAAPDYMYFGASFDKEVWLT